MFDEAVQQYRVEAAGAKLERARAAAAATVAAGKLADSLVDLVDTDVSQVRAVVRPQHALSLI